MTASITDCANAMTSRTTDSTCRTMIAMLPSIPSLIPISSHAWSISRRISASGSALSANRAGASAPIAAAAIAM